MANLANLLAEDHQLDEALRWARYATTAAPSYANGHRMRGKIARLAGRGVESRQAFEWAYRLEPGTAANRFNLALALLDAGDLAQARALAVSVTGDPVLGGQARALLAEIVRRGG
jgi:Flp pilus assembly protein TadD